MAHKYIAVLKHLRESDELHPKSMTADRFELLQWTMWALTKAKRKTKPAHPRVVERLDKQLTELCQEWRKDLVAAGLLDEQGKLK